MCGHRCTAPNTDRMRSRLYTRPCMHIKLRCTGESVQQKYWTHAHCYQEVPVLMFVPSMRFILCLIEWVLNTLKKGVTGIPVSLWCGSFFGCHPGYSWILFQGHKKSLFGTLSFFLCSPWRCTELYISQCFSASLQELLVMTVPFPDLVHTQPGPQCSQWLNKSRGCILCFYCWCKLGWGEKMYGIPQKKLN